MVRHSPAQLPRSSPPGGAPEARRARAREALVDYGCHGDALFSLALLLCRDVDLAAEAVVATLTRVDATPSEPCPDARRQHLAADLWNRCARVPDGRLPNLLRTSGRTGTVRPANRTSPTRAKRCLGWSCSALTPGHRLPR
ncbi:hypothetical protein [Streptomyces sp. NPDC096095]|uniref:hypothetical protein n=1 Tax=Streptomyces sp. NPDC096095 TaxID=3155545 RepID=UPI003334050C